MTASAIVGTCLEMCPDSERSRRERDGLLHRFETIMATTHGNASLSRRNKADFKRCVKEFSRAAAGQAVQKSSDLRPPSVLKKTVSYLFEKVLYETRDVEPYDVVYDFVFDRLRAVRQDMVVQNVCDDDCVHVLECIVRFHLYSIFRLCEEPISVFDPHINGIHVQECLKRLLVCYENGMRSENRIEIESYYLLYNLGSCDAMRHAFTLPKQLMVGVLAIALKINLAWLNYNFHRVMRLIVQDLPFLYCVAIMPNLPTIRRLTLNILVCTYGSAIRIMSHGFSAKNCRFPVVLLEKMLAFDDDAETTETCNNYGIQCVDNQFVVFYKPTLTNGVDSSLMPLKRYGFINEKHKHINLVDLLYGENT